MDLTRITLAIAPDRTVPQLQRTDVTTFESVMARLLSDDPGTSVAIVEKAAEGGDALGPDPGLPESETASVLPAEIQGAASAPPQETAPARGVLAGPVDEPLQERAPRSSLQEPPLQMPPLPVPLPLPVPSAVTDRGGSSAANAWTPAADLPPAGPGVLVEIPAVARATGRITIAEQVFDLHADAQGPTLRAPVAMPGELLAGQRALAQIPPPLQPSAGTPPGVATSMHAATASADLRDGAVGLTERSRPVPVLADSPLPIVRAGLPAGPAPDTHMVAGPPATAALPAAQGAGRVDGDGLRVGSPRSAPLSKPEPVFAAPHIATSLQNPVVIQPMFARQDIPASQPAMRLGSAVALPAPLRGLAEAAPTQPDQTIEITLTPQDLGRVRMRLMLGEGAPVLFVVADRTETQDLIRRHIDQLLQEFRAQGFEGVNVALGDSRGRSAALARTQSDATDPQQTAATAAPKSVGPRSSAVAADGLDLRL